MFLEKERRKRLKGNKDRHGKEQNWMGRKSGGIKERCIRVLRLVTMKREYVRWTIYT